MNQKLVNLVSLKVSLGMRLNGLITSCNFIFNVVQTLPFKLFLGLVI